MNVRHLCLPDAMSPTLQLVKLPDRVRVHDGLRLAMPNAGHQARLKAGAQRTL
jgi:hypothetical protein